MFLIKVLLQDQLLPVECYLNNAAPGQQSVQRPSKIKKNRQAAFERKQLGGENTTLNEGNKYQLGKW